MSRIKEAIARAQRAREQALANEQPVQDLGRLEKAGRLVGASTALRPPVASGAASGQPPPDGLSASLRGPVADVEPEYYICIDRESLRRAGLMAPEDHERRLAEEYRQIKRPVLSNATQKATNANVEHGNLVMVTSAMPGEGKTFTGINLALSIAREKDWHVLLVDGDVAKPHLTDLFGLNDAPGLLDLLRDPSLSVEQCILPTDISGVFVLPAGQQDEEATELLASQRMMAVRDLLANLSPGLIVLFDSPPLLLTTESRELATHVGQVLVVVKAQSTTHQQVVQAVSFLDSTKAISLVLNQAEFGADTFVYGYGVYGQTYDKKYGQPRGAHEGAELSPGA